MALGKLQQSLLNKQLLQAEIENLVEETEECEVQVSLYILSARNLQPSIHKKVHRQVKFNIESQVFETKLYPCEGINLTASWNEAHLFGVKSIDSCLKLVYLEHETSNRPLGGVVIKLTGLTDQNRHDGWYDLGCGEIRLAIRMIWDLGKMYKKFLDTICAKVSEEELRICRNNWILEDRLIERIYSGLRKAVIKRMVDEGCLFREIRKKNEESDEEIENQEFEKYEKEEKTQQEAENEDLDSFLKKMGEEMKDKSYSIKEIDMAFCEEDDVPPYIEAAEKMCKRRIAIKRY